MQSLLRNQLICAFLMYIWHFILASIAINEKVDGITVLNPALATVCFAMKILREMNHFLLFLLSPRINETVHPSYQLSNTKNRCNTSKTE
ncbi:hypothetical protein BDF20DRAFT_843770 [Mycotypha africana]|uniref:uncharacterized protein n=1 Tax=Mycotypha africana TaxID=64632 RepID=UPI0023018D54|nr:uncharacterized protein BDF20DRAFT_843770 [Mycotypha africana]KAI8991275.1 hypothetical protein BDF20DRAFT_843770 [Mycotypha africana]